MTLHKNDFKITDTGLTCKTDLLDSMNEILTRVFPSESDFKKIYPITATVILDKLLAIELGIFVFDNFLDVLEKKKLVVLEAMLDGEKISFNIGINNKQIMATKN